MADLVYKADSRSYVRGGTDWSAIWAGLFTFIALWSVFGLLGFAIFPRLGTNVTNVGFGIWEIILVTVAMYIAGHGTGKQAAISGRFDGAWHGMVVFGLSVTAGILLSFVGRTLFTGVGATASPAAGLDPLTTFGGNSWIAFVGLFLAWLGAMAGAASAVPKSTEQVSNVRNMRPAA